MTEQTKAYGVRHVMEEKMMADGTGVYEPVLAPEKKKAPASENKMQAAPANKAKARK